ncbi:hypothetical protein HN873_005208 [Arachis hypogaea]
MATLKKRASQGPNAEVKDDKDDPKIVDKIDPTTSIVSVHHAKYTLESYKKYFVIVHPKMDESLFGNKEQHNQVQVGHHPRSEFYHVFFGIATAMWLLHLLALTLNHAPSHFEASHGVEFYQKVRG